MCTITKTVHIINEQFLLWYTFGTYPEATGPEKKKEKKHACIKGNKENFDTEAW
jgi:hypothetical protein